MRKKNNSNFPPSFPPFYLFVHNNFPVFWNERKFDRSDRFQEYAAKFQNDGARVALKWDDGAEWLRDDLQGGMMPGGVGGWKGGGSMLGAVLSLPKKTQKTLFGVCNKNRDIERYEGYRKSFIFFLFWTAFHGCHGCFFLVGTSSRVLFFAPFFRGTWRRRDGQHLCCIQGGHIHWKNDISETAQQNKLQDAEGIQVTGVGGGTWRMEGRWQGCFHTHLLTQTHTHIFVSFCVFVETFIVPFVGDGDVGIDAKHLSGICVSEWDEKTEKLVFSGPKKLGIRSGDKPFSRITAGLPGLPNVRSARNQLNSRCFFLGH